MYKVLGQGCTKTSKDSRLLAVYLKKTEESITCEEKKEDLGGVEKTKSNTDARDDDEGPGEPDGMDGMDGTDGEEDLDSVKPNFVRKTATGRFAKFTKKQAARAASLQQLEEAWKCLGTPSKRLAYDLRCQERRTSWILKSKYDDTLEDEKEARARSLAQGVATRKRNEAKFDAEEIKPLLEAIAHLTTPGTNGHVTNRWKLAVGKCARLLREQGNTKHVATITKVVREASSPGKWDGKHDLKRAFLHPCQAFWG